MVAIDLLRFSLLALLSMLRSPIRDEHRSWRAEFVFRFTRRLFAQAKSKPIDWLRARQEAARQPVPKGVVFKREYIAGVDGCWCRPSASSSAARVIVYFHGGGYVVGSVHSYKNVLAELALTADAWVFGVDYRLGPENTFPAAQDDCAAVTDFILSEYADKPVILAGDSAGGGLALASYQSLVDAGKAVRPKALVLISPWVDPASQSPSMQVNETSDILNRELVERWGGSYLADTSPTHRRVNFRDMGCRGLVPVYIQAATAEVFIDQIRAFAEHARTAGAEVTLEEFPGMYHVFQIFSALLPESRLALNKIGGFIKALD